MILKTGEEKADFEFIRKFDNWFNSVRDKYLEGAKVFINSSKLTLGVFFVIVLFIFVMFKILPTGFLPNEDRGVIFTQIQLPDGSSASRTDIVAKEVEKRLLEIPGVKNTITLVGFDGENTSFVVAELDEWSHRKKKELKMNSILEKVQKEFANYPSAKIASFVPPAISGLGMVGGFEYQLLDKGDRTPQQLYDEAVKLVNAAYKEDKETNAIFTVLNFTYTATLPQLMIDVDASKAMAQNVSLTEAYSALASYFGRSYINDFNKLGRVFRVYVQADAPFREKPADLDKIFIKNNQGKMVPLSAVVKVKEVVGPYSLTRFNMYPAVTINGMVRQGISSGESMAKMAKISDKVLPKDMGFAWSGASLQESESSGQIGPILAMSLIFVYLFLVALYESWMLPMAVMLVSPIALVGALFFQYLAGFSLDLYSQIGLVMLIGLSTKQAILIIEFAKDAHSNGLPAREAATQAARLRFRAVMMTNIAFILGLLPLVFATGAGAASRNSVGMTVMGGMIAVAFVGTFLVPAFYVMIEEFKMFTARKFGKKKDKNNNV